MDIFIKEFSINHKIHKKITWIDIDNFRDIIFVGVKYDKLIDKYMDDDNIKSFGKKFFIDSTLIPDIIKSLNNHPEHYNAHQIFGFNIKFQKKLETKILAVIYKHYRKDYSMHYQHPKLEFRMDTHMVMEINQTGGLCIEIDENGHGNYNVDDHENRQKILESCGYYFVRIKPDKYTNDEIIEIIDQEINNYKLLYCTKIDPDVLWHQLKNDGIDKQFFQIIGKSIVCNKKFCVNFDDVAKFAGYGRSDNAMRFLKKNFRENKDYVSLRKSEIDSRNDLLLRSEELKSKSNNKIYILLTKFSFYNFILHFGTYYISFCYAKN